MLLATLALAGCPDRDLAQVVPAPEGAITKDVTLTADLDILFVIDNSGSTGDKQSLFQTNFQKIIDVLDRFPSGRPNLHIAVVDTSVDPGADGWCAATHDGGFQVGSNCGVNGTFLVDLAASGGVRNTNYSGTLRDTFTCMAQVGSNGCGIEQPLEAMKRALDGSRPENASFVRPGATLAVVILTDEDDASVRDSALFSLPGSHDDFRAQPLYAYACDKPISAASPGTYTSCRARTDSYLQDPAAYVRFLATVKDPAQTVIAVIASPPPAFATDDTPAQHANVNTDAIVTGPLTLNGQTQALALQPSTSCTIQNQTAIGRPAVRLASFLSNYSASHGRFYNVCQPDYSAALTDLSNAIIAEVSPCLPSEVQIPLDCAVSENGIVIPACAASGGMKPCWSADENPVACVAPTSGWELKIARSQPPPEDTVTQVQCAVGVQ